MGLAVDVPGEVLGRPAELEQRLLEVAALAGVDGHGLGLDPLTDHPGDLLGADDLLEHRAVDAAQHQPVHRMLVQPQAAVARHRLGHVDQQRMRHRVAAEGQQDVDHLLRVVAGSPRVPQTQRRQPVGVDVLRAPLELRERSDRLAARVRLLVVDLEEQRLVRLDDQGAIIHKRSILRTAASTGRRSPGPGRDGPRRPVEVTVIRSRAAGRLVRVRSMSRAPAESDAAVGHGLVVEAGVVDPLVVLVAQRDGVGRGRSCRRWPRVVGGGARTRRRGVRSRWRRRWSCSSPFARRWASVNERASVGRGRGRRTWCRGRRAGSRRCRRAGGLRRRRGSRRCRGGLL